MKKRCRFITYLLLVVSMVMLTANALPHHHHWGEFCMATCEADEAGHEHCHHIPTDTSQSHHHGETECCDGCVTNFRCQQPQTDNGVNDLVAYAIQTDFIHTIIEILLPERELPTNVFRYAERLPQSIVRKGMPLRAPPFDC